MYTMTLQSKNNNTLLATLIIDAPLSHFDKEEIVGTLQQQALKRISLLSGTLSMGVFERFLGTFNKGVVHVILGHDEHGVPMTAWGEVSSPSDHSFVDQYGDRHQLNGFEKAA